jgi:hypothetical protein
MFGGGDGIRVLVIGSINGKTMTAVSCEHCHLLRRRFAHREHCPLGRDRCSSAVVSLLWQMLFEHRRRAFQRG